MVRQIRRREVLVGSASLMAGLAGCGGSENPFQDGDNNRDQWEMKIGILAPESGSLETFGPEMIDAVELIKQQLDAAEASVTLDLSIKDTESDPEAAVSAAQELADDGYEAIIGPGTSESANAVIEEVLNPESLVAISPLAAGHDNGLDGEDRLFTNAPTGSTIGRAASRPIAVSGVQSMAIVYADNEYGRSIGTVTEEESSLRGIDVVATVGIEDLEASSYASELEEAMADDPEAVVIAADSVTGIQLVKDYYANHEPRTMFLGDRLRLPELQGEIEGALDEVRVVSLRPVWTSRLERGSSNDDEETSTVEAGDTAEVLLPFHRAFESAYDRFPTIQAAQSFDAAAVLLLAAVAAGEDDYAGDALRDEIRKVVNEKSNIENVRAYSQDDYWEGLSAIGDGVHNNYDGASNPINFGRARGELESPTLHASKFASDSETGFEEILPIRL